MLGLTSNQILRVIIIFKIQSGLADGNYNLYACLAKESIRFASLHAPLSWTIPWMNNTNSICMEQKQTLIVTD
ncbi:MAG TPA: hypothetical protein VKA91_07110 [Nitrososphaeraceae archaeon]|nr:hypothetical protein [Nitrososphaeraceae archaeon]